jgi:hypothetical protein
MMVNKKERVMKKAKMKMRVKKKPKVMIFPKQGVKLRKII